MLHIIANKVLDARSHTIVLQPLDVARGNHARQERVLGEAFKRATVQRVTLDVDRRREKHGCALGLAFFSEKSAGLVHEVEVE